MCLLRTVFLILLAIAVAIVAGNVPWQGTLAYGDGRLILDLDRAPLWDPPPMPREQDFLSKFSHLPAGAREHWVIERSVWMESMLVELLGALWIVFGLAGVRPRPLRAACSASWRGSSSP